MLTNSERGKLMCILIDPRPETEIVWVGSCTTCGQPAVSRTSTKVCLEPFDFDLRVDAVLERVDRIVFRAGETNVDLCI